MSTQGPTRPPIARALDLLSTFCTWLSGLSLVALVLTFAWLVFGRYVLNDTPTWVEQLALLLVINITFLSSAVGVRQCTHLSVDIVPLMCGPRTQLTLKFIRDLILGGFAVLMVVQGYKLLDFNWYKQIPLLNVSEGIRYIPVVASGVLITLFCLDSAIRSLFELFGGEQRVEQTMIDGEGSA